MILIDSNIIIYLAKKEFKNLRNYLSRIPFKVSIISKIEILGYSKLTSTESFYFEKFFENSDIIKIDNSIINATINLRKKYKLSLGDAFIASTSLIYNLELLTYNTKDFINIEELNLIDINKIQKI